MPGDRPRRIAVLGGGLGSLAAAYALTLVPEARARLEIHVYQAGWRLGGKGASGRNARRHDRIEEHGLHVWLGFYQNAFAMIRHCYASLETLSRSPGEARARGFAEAFTRHSELVVAEPSPSGYRQIRMRFPQSAHVPGGSRLRVVPGLGHYTSVGSTLLRSAWSACRRGAAGASLRRLGEVLVAVGADKRRRLRSAEPSPLPPKIADDDARRGLFELVDLTLTVALGLAVELGVHRKRLDDLDDEEFLEWLARWGAHAATRRSPLLRGIYDMGFAFDRGDPERPNFAAGAFLRAMLRILLTYEGAIFWKMNGGMGDVVFAPLYRVLRARGVRFHFFHRVDRIDAAEGEPRRVERILVTRQARARAEPYEPLRDVGGEPCWPSEPDFEQLEDGDRLREHVRWLEDPRIEAPGYSVSSVELLRGRDFDDVVLGIPVAALRTIAAPLARACPRFGRMLVHLQTVQTQAAQLWLRPDLSQLGYDEPAPVLAGQVEPLNTWADMSHLLEHEGWAPGEVGSLAYYCGPRPGPEEPALESEAEEARSIEQTTRDMLAVKARTLWPRSQGPDGGFDERLLAGGEALEDQYLRVNSAPSERYVLTAAGTTRFRLPPDDSGFDNLYLCGDWTRNDFNTGCVEATVMSGLEAARALARYPFRVVGARRGRWSSRASLWERRASP